ncbi:piggyBac transposable element-derived protein 4-like [Belonocnema kinseyi]|uniref:piggyBac transposable element-derived protein 4-like n=1 Tax=Belonocnema kinseyi TaxID=2817044 RepID=UPI00143DE202|nr:piggyBac transposable element-derived protein 4-like [Belonocnema kinseyi]
MWDKFDENCGKYCSPSAYVTVDVTLLIFGGKCPFRMYIPSKPDKYGLKIISACDARTFYFLKGIPYVDHEITKRKGDLSLPTQYVLRLTGFITGRNRNVTVDNWFSSVKLTEELAKKLTMVGTLRKNKPPLPPSMISARTPVLYTEYLYQPDKMILSHTHKKNKKVVWISSVQCTGERGESKPEIIEFSNSAKSGVDVLDKFCHDKTTKRTTRRWPLRYFLGILDIAAVNSFVLYKWNLNLERYSKEARTYLLKTLAFQLTETRMTRRAYNLRISKQLRLSIK